MNENIDITMSIKNEIKSNEVVLFMKGTPDFPMCGFSASIVQVLKDMRVEFNSVNVLDNDRIREGIKNWLQIIEEHYGVTPIIYTGLSFYNQQIKGSIDNKYPLWIAAYSGRNRLTEVDWIFHQFTTKVHVKGIRGKVDGNDFNGSLKQLKNLTI